MLSPSVLLRDVAAVSLLPSMMSLTESGTGMEAAGVMSGSCGLSTGG